MLYGEFMKIAIGLLFFILLVVAAAGDSFSDRDKINCCIKGCGG